MVNESAALASCFVLYDLCFSGLWSKLYRVLSFPSGQASSTSVLISPQVLPSVPQHPLCPSAEQGTNKVTARSTARTMLHPKAGKLRHNREEEVRSGIFMHFTVWYHLTELHRTALLHCCQGAALARRRKENCLRDAFWLHGCKMHRSAAVMLLLLLTFPAYWRGSSPERSRKPVSYWPSNKEDQTNRSRSSFAEWDAAKSKLRRDPGKDGVYVAKITWAWRQREKIQRNNFVGWNGREVFRNLPLTTDV